MASIRISADIRDTIIRNALTQRFSAEQLAITEAEEELAQLRRERDKMGYEAVFCLTDRQRLSAAPSGWYPEHNEVKVAVEGTNEVLCIKFHTAQRVPYDVYESRYHTKIANIIPADHPYMAAHQAVKDAVERVNQLNCAKTEAERHLRARIRAVVESVTTVSRLVEVWPEVTDFLPEEMAGPKAGLPATLISDLNAQLGITPKE